MTDFDSIWRTQDEIRTVVNAVLGECIWNLSYNERRMAIELEITKNSHGGTWGIAAVIPKYLSLRLWIIHAICPVQC